MQTAGCSSQELILEDRWGSQALMVSALDIDLTSEEGPCSLKGQLSIM